MFDDTLFHIEKVLRRPELDWRDITKDFPRKGIYLILKDHEGNFCIATTKGESNEKRLKGEVIIRLLTTVPFGRIVAWLEVDKYQNYLYQIPNMELILSQQDLFDFKEITFKDENSTIT